MKATTGRIWEAASDDKSRQVLTHVMFDAEKATLTATNSYIAARVPCEVEDGDESGLIPAAALKEANGRSLRIGECQAHLSLPDGGGRTWPLLSDAKWPDFDELFSKYGEIPAPFGINHDLLAQVGRALGCGGKTYTPLVLHPVSPIKGMRVSNPREGDGIVMPVRISFPTEVELPADYTNDEVVIAAVRAAMSALANRRGKARAVTAFRIAAAEATRAATTSAPEKIAA